VTPIILLVGPANSGKDTVANLIAENYNGKIVSLADPFKRFTQKLFGFTEKQLWGPSEWRNAPDFHHWNYEKWERTEKALWSCSKVLINECFKDFDEIFIHKKIQQWFELVRKEYKVGSGSLLRSQLDAHMAGQNFADLSMPPTPRYVLQTLGSEFGRKINRDVWVNCTKAAAFKLLSGGFDYTKENGLIASESAPPDWAIVSDGRFRNEILNIKAVGGIAIKIINPDDKPIEVGVQGHRSESEQKNIPDHFFDYLLYNNKEEGLVKLKAIIHRLMGRLRGTKSC
jgi:hypothetical protein